MTNTYCLRCKKITKDVKPHIVMTSNGRKMRQSLCSICGMKKCVFLPGGQKGGNPLALVSAVAEAAPGLVNGISNAIDQGRRTDREFAREDGQLNIDRDKKFQQYYRDLVHDRFWDGEKLPPRLRWPREKTNNPKYAAEQEAKDDALYAYAEKKFYGR